MTVQIPVETLHPTTRMLSDEQIQVIYQAGLDILERTGIVMKHDAVRELLLGAGTWESNGRIKVPDHVVMAAIGAAPSRILMHGRLGQLTMPLEEGKVFFGPGSDCPFTLAREAIDRAKTGGGFLADDHTLSHWKWAQWRPKMIGRSRYDTWVAKGKKDMASRANERAREILATRRVSPLPPAAEEVIADALARRGA